MARLCATARRASLSPEKWMGCHLIQRLTLLSGYFKISFASFRWLAASFKCNVAETCFGATLGSRSCVGRDIFMADPWSLTVQCRHRSISMWTRLSRKLLWICQSSCMDLVWTMVHVSWISAKFYLSHCGPASISIFLKMHYCIVFIHIDGRWD
jgi:hypothetical protein